LFARTAASSDSRGTLAAGAREASGCALPASGNGAAGRAEGAGVAPSGESGALEGCERQAASDTSNAQTSELDTVGWVMAELYADPVAGV
jgi:hypothetical protein